MFITKVSVKPSLTELIESFGTEFSKSIEISFNDSSLTFNVFDSKNEFSNLACSADEFLLLSWFIMVLGKKPFPFSDTLDDKTSKLSKAENVFFSLFSLTVTILFLNVLYEEIASFVFFIQLLISLLLLISTLAFRAFLISTYVFKKLYFSSEFKKSITDFLLFSYFVCKSLSLDSLLHSSSY
ncbi:hypothetical protein ACQRA7_01020 [Mycoplasmopsis bovis]|uniref:hypothetical protein n=1 Tax=Mycoplasmopsis bovis TaxID=28903 RepID=UPI0027DAC0F7|nr:hypothetical protein [Mycoplasmopsis bovis]